MAEDGERRTRDETLGSEKSTRHIATRTQRMRKPSEATSLDLHAEQETATHRLVRVLERPDSHSHKVRRYGAVISSLLAHGLFVIATSLLLAPQILKTTEILMLSLKEEPERVEDFELDRQVHAFETQNMGVASGTLGFEGDAIGAMRPPSLDLSVEEDEGTEIRIDDPFLGSMNQSFLREVPDGAIGSARELAEDYEKALDRITQELMWLLEEHELLLIWCFDESESMKDDQEDIANRIDRIYQELDFNRTSNSDKMLTAVTSFGSEFHNHTPKPLSDLRQVQAAIRRVPIDPTGVEMMCQAVGKSISTHRGSARRRKMVLVLVTDESGDREESRLHLEHTIDEVKKARCRVYVMGREAAFGYPLVHVRWEHPLTRKILMLPVDRGPETAFLEQLQTDGFGERMDFHSSGFGPYAQSRLAQQTNGIFFLMPSGEDQMLRGVDRRFEFESMALYKPDLNSLGEIHAQIESSPLRKTILRVVQDLNPLDPRIAETIVLQQSFPPLPDKFSQEARLQVAKASVYIDYLQKVIDTVEAQKSLREQESAPRWQANYDLLRAQVSAYAARVYEYGACLEQFLQNPRVVPMTRPPNLRLVAWRMKTCEELSAAETTKPYIEHATGLLKTLMREHPGTAWAARSEWELRRGFGVELEEYYVADAPPAESEPSAALVRVPNL